MKIYRALCSFPWTNKQINTIVKTKCIPNAFSRGHGDVCLLKLHFLICVSNKHVNDSNESIIAIYSLRKTVQDIKYGRTRLLGYIFIYDLNILNEILRTHEILPIHLDSTYVWFLPWEMAKKCLDSSHINSYNYHYDTFKLLRQQAIHGSLLEMWYPKDVYLQTEELSSIFKEEYSFMNGSETEAWLYFRNVLFTTHINYTGLKSKMRSLIRHFVNKISTPFVPHEIDLDLILDNFRNLEKKHDMEAIYNMFLQYMKENFLNSVITIHASMQYMERRLESYKHFPLLSSIKRSKIYQLLNQIPSIEGNQISKFVNETILPQIERDIPFQNVEDIIFDSCSIKVSLPERFLLYEHNKTNNTYSFVSKRRFPEIITKSLLRDNSYSQFLKHSEMISNVHDILKITASYNVPLFTYMDTLHNLKFWISDDFLLNKTYISKGFSSVALKKMLLGHEFSQGSQIVEKWRMCNQQAQKNNNSNIFGKYFPGGYFHEVINPNLNISCLVLDIDVCEKQFCDLFWESYKFINGDFHIRVLRDLRDNAICTFTKIQHRISDHLGELDLVNELKHVFFISECKSLNKVGIHHHVIFPSWFALKNVSVAREIVRALNTIRMRYKETIGRFSTSIYDENIYKANYHTIRCPFQNKPNIDDSSQLLPILCENEISPIIMSLNQSLIHGGSFSSTRGSDGKLILLEEITDLTCDVLNKTILKTKEEQLQSSFKKQNIVNLFTNNLSKFSQFNTSIKDIETYLNGFFKSKIMKRIENQMQSVSQNIDLVAKLMPNLLIKWDTSVNCFIIVRSDTGSKRIPVCCLNKHYVSRPQCMYYLVLRSIHLGIQCLVYTSCFASKCNSNKLTPLRKLKFLLS